MASLAAEVIEQALLETQFHLVGTTRDTFQDRMQVWRHAMNKMLLYVEDVIREYPDMEQDESVRTVCNLLAARVHQEIIKTESVRT